MYHVERGAESDLSTFVTIYTSEAAKGVAWNDGARVTVSIDPLPDKGIPPVERTFKAVFSNEGIEMIALFGARITGRPSKALRWETPWRLLNRLFICALTNTTAQAKTS